MTCSDSKSLLAGKVVPQSSFCEFCISKKWMMAKRSCLGTPC